MNEDFEKQLETLSYTIDDILMYMSNTHKIEPMILASVFLARLTLMCETVGEVDRFRMLCGEVASKSIDELVNEKEVD